MSVHGLCFDNGQSGNCNCDCGLFRGGECEAADDVIEDLYATITAEEFNELIESQINAVKLFTLKGAGTDDLELLHKAFGY
jgi:hypothetical protein